MTQFFFIDSLFLGIEIFSIENNVGNSRVDRGDNHHSRSQKSYGWIHCHPRFCRIEQGFNEGRNDADDLCDGFDLSRKMRRHIDRALSRHEVGSR